MQLQASEGASSCRHLDLRLPTSRRCETSTSHLKPPSLWSFVPEAPGHSCYPLGSWVQEMRHFLEASAGVLLSGSHQDKDHRGLRPRSLPPWQGAPFKNDSEDGDSSGTRGGQAGEPVPRSSQSFPQALPPCVRRQGHFRTCPYHRPPCPPASWG